MTDRTLPRRALLAAAGVISAGALLASSARAQADTVRAGRLSFTPPDGVQSVPPADGWQWQGERPGSPAPAVIVLARGDLTPAAPDELLNLLIAPAAAGRLPDLRLDDRRTVSEDNGDQLRQSFSYTPTRGVSYSGTALFTSGPDHSGILLIAGSSAVLTAGRVDQLLDSARWVS
ncbi:hypothetical protein FOE78_12515 [Microlunatus elymi]|uniref:Lipoprotein LpqN n=1 Tax=Microlunatus elymi TaxID=2596828 RepID=A0A516PZL1_9ACTN|nr:hypothetical protein [Microlunatus elymi]QDP96625.1 hypothetical protein FOE78_12515 [Microlunatus elymi]